MLSARWNVSDDGDQRSDAAQASQRHAGKAKEGFDMGHVADGHARERGDHAGDAFEKRREGRVVVVVGNHGLEVSGHAGGM